MIVSAAEADVSVTSPTADVNYCSLYIYNSQWDKWCGVFLQDTTFAPQNGWFYELPDGTRGRIGTDTSNSGTMSVSLVANGDDLDYTFVCPGGTEAGTATGYAASGDWDSVVISFNRFLNGGTAECLSTSITHGAVTTYPWDSSAELDDWGIYPTHYCEVSGGTLHPAGTWVYASIGQVFTPSVGRAITSVLSAPGIQRIAAVSSANVLQDRYASGALADILTGSIADNHPELVHVGAGGHHLGLVWQRTNDICITTGTGVPGITGWPNTVQTVALARSKPTACVIDPTHDLGVAYLNGTEALFSPAAWANGSYVMGTETLIASDSADERGQLLQSPDGYLLYVYRDSGGAVAIKRSANRGQTWS